MKILLIEDDKWAASHIATSLNSHGHAVDVCNNGLEGEDKARNGRYEALIVDRMLPGRDGLSIIRALREDGLQIPILILTTMSSIADRVHGLECGADDYLTKPFAVAELLARINTIARRTALRGEGTLLKAGGLEMDLVRHTVTRDGRIIELQSQEFHLLEYLMRNAGRAVTRSMLLENVWNMNFSPNTNLVDTHISRLRTKIGCKERDEIIRTIRGTGYLLSA